MTVADSKLAAGKQGAALASVLSGLVLTVMKLLVGFSTGSLGILSEAAHSALDLFAAGLTFLVVRVSDLPPDSNHPYGHARAEHLGALAETMLLVATAGWVLWKAFEHIIGEPATPEITIWSFVVMICSLGIDWQRARALRKAAEVYQSPALAADAAHFSNDMLSTGVVLAGLALTGATRLGLPVFPWLAQRADAFAAIGVAVIALYVSWGLGVRAVRALMDDVPDDLNQRLVVGIAAVPGVVGLTPRVRTRFVGSQAYVDVSVQVPRAQTLEEAHQTTEGIEEAVRRELTGADVVVHVEPARSATEPYATTVYAAAHQLGLHVHNLDIFLLQAGMLVGVDLEIPGTLSLAEAHRYSERFEQLVRQELPVSAEVAVHLEPRRDVVQPAVRYLPIQEQIRTALANYEKPVQVGEIEVLLTDNGVVVMLRCGFPGMMPLHEVHTVMARLERYLRRAVPEMLRVQIDPEPIEQTSEKAG